MDEWYDYENIRRVRRLDCESYREEAEVQNKGKKLTTKRLMSLSYLENQRQKRPIHLTNLFLRISS